jgi:dTMP kinase
MIEGMFVVLEGIDGAGTTTQTQRLVDTLRKRGLPVRSTRQPSDGPVGALIRQILTGRVVSPGVGGMVSAPSWNTMALLFAADRLDHIDAEIAPNMHDGVIVVSDRYDYSSVAYQCVSAGATPETVEWVRAINRFARRPDLTIVLDVSAEVAEARRRGRSGRVELYDDDGLQRQIAEFYRTIEVHFPGDHIVHVDASKTPDVVAAAVLAHFDEARGGLPSVPRR